MTRLIDAVKVSLASGPRSSEDILSDCRGQGIPLKPETITLFLHLAQGVVRHGEQWRLKGDSKEKKLLQATEEAFSEGGTYVPVKKLRDYLDEDLVFTKEDLHNMAESAGMYQLQGDYIIRKK